MSHQITIAGTAFAVTPRYAEGHTLNANEASALNQTFFENLRNNFAAKAKEGATQEDFDAYAASYQFGVRTGGGGSRDPVLTEALNMARDSVRQAIKKAGKNVSEYSAASITAAAQKLVDQKPEYMEKAKQRVAEMQNIASDSIGDDLLADLQPAAPAENDTDVVTTEETAEQTGEAEAAPATGKRK